MHPETDELDLGHLLQQSFALFAARPALHVLASAIAVVGGLATAGALLGPLLSGYLRLVDRQAEGREVGLRDLLLGFDRMFASFAVTLIAAGSVALGLTVLIVPGVLAFVAFAFALWFVALAGTGAMTALRQSWQLARQQAASVVLLLLLAVAINCVGGALVFAALLTIPFTLTMLTLAFRRLRPQGAHSPA